jgi:hypothetical protein
LTAEPRTTLREQLWQAIKLHALSNDIRLFPPTNYAWRRRNGDADDAVGYGESASAIVDEASIN